MSFSSSTIENLKNQINIIDVVGSCVTLKRAGSNYKGACPFHNEKTPSFVVSESKQIFTCFGCGAKGDAIGFVERYYNLDFSEAVEKLAGQYGIELERTRSNDKYDIYYEVNKLAARFFYDAFTQKANKGYTYMKNRGISPAILKKFGIGYADESWDSLYKYLLSKGIDKKIMLELGLISESKGKCYDKFRNRVIFPIINTSGKVIGFGGRAISSNDNPKYLNSPESKIFQKKNNLYGLNLSRQNLSKAGKIILVEGYMDVISLYQSGVDNVAASLGTALTENQAKLIKRYTKNVVLSYDADGAGRAAALRGLEILKAADCKVKVLHVTDGKDPDEYIKKNGKNEFLKLVDTALPYGDYKLEAAKAGYNLKNDEDKIDYLKKAVEIIEKLSPVEQEIYIKKVSDSLKISPGAIRLELSGGSVPKNNSSNDNRISKSTKDNSDSCEITPLEKNLLKVLLTNESYIDEINNYPHIIDSSDGKGILEVIVEEYKNNHSVDAKIVLDSLPEHQAALLQEIIDTVIVGGNESEVFNQCIDTWKSINLKKREEEIITLLSMADEEDNQEKIVELTKELMQIQQLRKQ